MSSEGTHHDADAGYDTTRSSVNRSVLVKWGGRDEEAKEGKTHRSQRPFAKGEKGSRTTAAAHEAGS